MDGDRATRSAQSDGEGAAAAGDEKHAAGSTGEDVSHDQSDPATTAGSSERGKRRSTVSMLFETVNVTQLIIAILLCAGAL